jgi:hypothetical protein
MNLFDKIKIHIEDVAWSKSLRFAFYTLIQITNRRLGLPLSVVDKSFGGSEKYLEKYMIPKNNGCFIDVGANWGMWTFFVAKKGVEVHAFNQAQYHLNVLKKEQNHIQTFMFIHSL